MKKLPSVKTAITKCDNILSPIIIKQFPNCLLCGNLTQVAHHHCHKSKSTRLRYDLKNLIPLCSSCHFKLHQNESYWASVIVNKKGLEWFIDLDKTKDEYVKADVHYYIANYDRLKAILEE